MMKIPLKPLAILGVLWQILVLLGLSGFAVPTVERVTFLFGCGLFFYSFLAGCTHGVSFLRSWFARRQMRHYNWLRRVKGGETKSEND
jgi:hypothetical protein